MAMLRCERLCSAMMVMLRCEQLRHRPLLCSIIVVMLRCERLCSVIMVEAGVWDFSERYGPPSVHTNHHDGESMRVLLAIC